MVDSGEARDGSGGGSGGEDGGNSSRTAASEAVMVNTHAHTQAQSKPVAPSRAYGCAYDDEVTCEKMCSE